MPGDNQDLPRTPPVAVRRELRREVGFGCPVSGCGNPYLQYHHFDPPWEKEHHHDPARMIALCAEHHAKAAAWTVEDCRAMKAAPADRPEVRGRFEWMREDVLAVIGGGLYYETPNMVVFRGRPMIWFERDEQRRLLLNFRMLTASREPRASLESNDWIIRGDPADVESPPNGSWLRVRYDNGDDLSIRFRERADAGVLGGAYPVALDLGPVLRFPLVTAEITFEVGGTDISFGPTKTRLGGGRISNLTAAYCANGLAFG
jgi:hypothetical protein